MSAHDSNPYSSPLPVEKVDRQCERPSIRACWRGARADLQWSDRAGALRTGLRLLAVSMLAATMLSGLRLWFVIHGPPVDIDSLVSFLKFVRYANSALVLTGLAYLYRGAPDRWRIATACIAALVLSYLVEPLVAWHRDRRTVWDARDALAWFVPTMVAAWVFVALRQIFLMRLALADSTKRLAVCSVWLHVTFLVIDVTSLLLWFQNDDRFNETGVRWSSIVMVACYMSLAAFEFFVVIRVLQESCSGRDHGASSDSDFV